jgi:membrane protein CcdC involved in cytochrome C biogenesis
MGSKIALLLNGAVSVIRGKACDKPCSIKSIKRIGNVGVD